MLLTQQLETWLRAQGQRIVETDVETGVVRSWGQQEHWTVSCALGHLPPDIAFHAALGAAVTTYRGGGATPTTFALALPETDEFRRRVEELPPAIRETLPWLETLWVSPDAGTVIHISGLTPPVLDKSVADEPVADDPVTLPDSPAARLCHFLLLCPVPEGATETAVARAWSGRTLDAKLLEPGQARATALVPLVRLAAHLQHPGPGGAELQAVRLLAMLAESPAADRERLRQEWKRAFPSLADDRGWTDWQAAAEQYGDWHAEEGPATVIPAAPAAAARAVAAAAQPAPETLAARPAATPHAAPALLAAAPEMKAVAPVPAVTSAAPSAQPRSGSHTKGEGILSRSDPEAVWTFFLSCPVTVGMGDNTAGQAWVRQAVQKGIITQEQARGADAAPLVRMVDRLRKADGNRFEHNVPYLAKLLTRLMTATPRQRHGLRALYTRTLTMVASELVWQALTDGAKHMHDWLYGRAVDRQELAAVPKVPQPEASVAAPTGATHASQPKLQAPTPKAAAPSPATSHTTPPVLQAISPGRSSAFPAEVCAYLLRSPIAPGMQLTAVAEDWARRAAAAGLITEVQAEQPVPLSVVRIAARFQRIYPSGYERKALVVAGLMSNVATAMNKGTRDRIRDANARALPSLTVDAFWQDVVTAATDLWGWSGVTPPAAEKSRGAGAPVRAQPASSRAGRVKAEPDVLASPEEICRFLLVLPLPQGRSPEEVAEWWAMRAQQAGLVSAMQARKANLEPVVRLAMRLTSVEQLTEPVAQKVASLVSRMMQAGRAGRLQLWSQASEVPQLVSDKGWKLLVAAADCLDNWLAGATGRRSELP